MQKILCPGEALIDFVAIEAKPLIECNEFLKKAGGAPANAAGAMTKFGVESYFYGTVGNDPFGHYLAQELQAYNIKTDYLTQSDLAFTSFAYVSIDQNGERDFIFNRGADQFLNYEENIINHFNGVHFASATAFLGGQLEQTYYQLLSDAHKAGKFISFDANYREALFSDKQKVFAQKCRDFIALSTIVKLSEEEAQIISGQTEIKAAGKIISQLGCQYLIITLGAKGALLFTKNQVDLIESIKIEQVVDTTGAGDAFIGAVVAQAIKCKHLNFAQMIKIIKLANKVGAMTTMHYGALESIPSLSQATGYHLQNTDKL